MIDYYYYKYYSALTAVTSLRVGLIYIADIYHRYISHILVQKYRTFSICFAGLWLVPSAFSQCWTTFDKDCTSPQQCSVNDKSTSPNMQSTHTQYFCNVCANARYTLCSKKSDAKIQITITMALLIRIILLAASIIVSLAQTLQISTKSTTVSEQQLF